MRYFVPAALALCAVLASPCSADTFGTGDNQFSIEFVPIGSPGNAADTTGDPNPAGAVDYSYRIGKYEIPEHAIRRANAQSAEEGDPLSITLDERGPNKPATRVSWFEAARFINWLNEQKGATPAYKFDSAGEFQLWEPTDAGYNPDNLFRNANAIYFLPSADEWYKAAFFDSVTETYFDYPNGMNTPPIAVASGTDPNTAVWNQPFLQGPADVSLAGGNSLFGVHGLGGNVHEFQETSSEFINDDSQSLRLFRGGQWISAINATSLSSNVLATRLPGVPAGDIGFRVASVIPEPTAFIMLALAVGGWMILRRNS